MSGKGAVAAKPPTKGEIQAALCRHAGITPAQAGAVLQALPRIVGEALRGRGAPGKITLPGLARFTAKHRPARKAHKGKNPFTGEETTFKARPATTVVKVHPAKPLKDAVAGVKS